MKGLDCVYDKFESLILFLESEVSIVSDCDNFIEAKEALDILHQLSSIAKKGGVFGKLYRVIDNIDMEYYNVKVGDICTLVDNDENGAWFKNDSWKGDGVWFLLLNMVEEVK